MGHHSPNHTNPRRVWQQTENLLPHFFLFMPLSLYTVYTYFSKSAACDKQCGITFKQKVACQITTEN